MYAGLDAASPMSAPSVCSVSAFGVVCAVMSVHMDVQHVMPARELPFTPLRPCRAVVDAF